MSVLYNKIPIHLIRTVSAEDYFVGERYIRFDDEIGRDDEALMPLYDVNGFIAGLQAAVSTGIIQY